MRGGFYGKTFTFLKITLLVFNKYSQNHDEYIVCLFVMNCHWEKNEKRISFVIKRLLKKNNKEG